MSERKAPRSLGRLLGRALLAGFALAAAVVILNRFDKLAARSGHGERDLPPSSLGADNGAFWLLFLGEPESEGLAVERKAADYGRQLRELERVERPTWQVPPRTRPLGARYWQTIADIPFPRAPEWDWAGFLRTERARLARVRSGLSVLLTRYGRMIRCGAVADFGYRFEWDRAYALSAFVQATARLHAALCLLDAEGGAWTRATDELAAAVRFGERLMAAAQTVFFNSLGRSIVEAALEGLAGLLNLPGCPRAVDESLLDALPTSSETRFGAHSALIGEFLWQSDRVERGDRLLQSELAFRQLLPGRGGDQTRLTVNVLLGRQLGPETYMRLREVAFDLFLQKNRTKAYLRAGLDWLLALDATPPFRWGEAAAHPPAFGRLNVSWLLNPSGRLLYESFGLVRQKRVIERAFLARALSDLVRLSASLHLDRQPEGDEGRDLGPLDPFSGRPYRWDAGRSLLWSVGADGKDDQGDAATDLILPVRIAGR